MSCYGINLSWESGDNIIHGDYSPEELRLEAYAQIKTSNNILKYIEAVNNVSLQQKIKIENVLSNISGAVLRAKTPRSLRIELESRVTTPSSVKPTSNSTCPKISTSNTNVPFSTVGEFTFGEIPEIPPS